MKGKPLSKMVNTGPVPVVFSHLDSLDTKFDKQGNHNITVSVDGKFKAIMKKIHTELGEDRIVSGNKVHPDHGEQQTFKSVLHRDQTGFPEIWNHKREKLSGVFPDFGDKVNIRFIAKQTDVNKDKYISMYLDAVQILEKTSGDECPFDEVEVNTDDELMKILNSDD